MPGPASRPIAFHVSASPWQRQPRMGKGVTLGRPVRVWHKNMPLCRVKESLLPKVKGARRIWKRKGSQSTRRLARLVGLSSCFDSWLWQINYCRRKGGGEKWKEQHWSCLQIRAELKSAAKFCKTQTKPNNDGFAKYKQNEPLGLGKTFLKNGCKMGWDCSAKSSRDQHDWLNHVELSF